MACKETSKEILELTRITKKRIQDLCKKDKLYQTPELNDVLYLHYQGFDCIECLEDYTELKCLWLECNAISEIQGLCKQTKLKCLFLQSNLITKIENLEYCKELDTLNLSQNHIRKIENCGFEELPVLNTLNLASNYLKDSESLKALVHCKTLSVLDLSNNRIDDILVVKIFSQMPELKVLVLQGNPVVSKIPQYRKTLILECKKLTYLDSRPVFPKDRACAEAWKRGGYAEERNENERWNRKERKKMRDCVNATINLRNKHRKPEDQVSCIPSSEDEEDETRPQKKNIKIQQHSDVSDESIWDEVKDETISNSDNEDKNYDSSSTKEGCKKETTYDDTIIQREDNIEIIKQPEIGEQYKILKPELKEQEKHSSQAECAELAEVKKHEHCEAENNSSEVLITLKDSTDKQLKEPEPNSAQYSLAETESLEVTKYSGFSESSADESYASTIEAIQQISVSLDSVEPPPKLAAKVSNSKEENCYDNYELFKELEETMSVFSQKDEQRLCKFEKMEENSQRKSEEAKECLKINNQLKADFEELSTNMSSFLNKLEKEQNEHQEIKNSLLGQDKSVEDHNFDKLELKSKLDLKLETDQTKVKIPETETETRISEHISDSLLNYPVALTPSANADNYIEHEMDPESNKSISNLEYVPLDIAELTRKSNQALISLEAESKALKTLLEKLENRNDDILKENNSKEIIEKEADICRYVEVNLKMDNEHDDHFKQDIEEDTLRENSDLYRFQNKSVVEESMKNDLQEVKQIVETILEEILQTFDVITLKPNSLKFSYDLSEEKEDLKFMTQSEIIPKTIPEVIKSFKQLCTEMKAQQEPNLSFPLDNPIKKTPLCLKELSLKPNLKQFNKDTLQSLNAELKEIRKRQHKKVRRMVDRVYAQKDRYKDTLELVDTKLMVRNHATNELQELPSKSLQAETSDSENDDYDTALSDTDEMMEEKFKAFKPKPRKSNEDLIFKAFNQYEQQLVDSDESEESTDEFYSLDTQRKPSSLYTIDNELFNNLNFDLSNLTQQDENRIVQCARSYEALKHCLALNKEEQCFNEPEKSLLENIAKRNESDKEETLWFHANSFGKDQQEQQQTSQPEKSCEETVTKSLLRDVFINQASNELLQEKNRQPQYSEEEKYEIENNADVENDAAEEKIFAFEHNYGISPDFEDEKNDRTLEQFAKTETIECSLEIFSDNDDLMDTITVNAELHFS